MIQINNVTKSFSGTNVLDHLQMHVPKGSIYGLVGPNGAGKSTIIKSIAGLLRYEGGVGINGMKARSLEAKKIFGYVPEIPAMFEALTVREHIEYVKRAYNSDITEEEIDALLTRFELLDKQEKLGNELSKGMMQKVSICCALAIHPKVVMLDEPMVGLDPAAIKELKEVVLELKEKGCTILISTHMLEMVKDLWDVMFVMEQGKIIATFNKNEIADKDIEELFFEVTETKTGGEEHE